MNREILWNAVHKIEKSKDAQLWREIEVALPKELKLSEQIETVKKFVKIVSLLTFFRTFAASKTQTAG